MTASGRRWLMLPICLALLGFLCWAYVGLPDFGDFHGSYGRLLDAVGVRQRHATNVVAAIVFDYRGFDTLGEEFILFASAAGVAFLLRSSDGAKEQRPPDAVDNELLRVAGLGLVPVVALVGLWVVAYGYVTPGGGFQGGVVIACALLLVWIAGSYRDFSSVTNPAVVDFGEGVGAAAYVVIGLVGLGVTGSYLGNFLGLGTPGSLDSSGSITLLNGAAGVEVAAALLLLFREFLVEYVQVLPEGREE